MAGKILRLVNKRVIDFSNCATGTGPVYVLLERIDLSQYIDAMLAVRVHAVNVAGSSFMTIDLYGDGYTDDDPGILFVTNGTYFSSTIINSAVIAPTLLTYGGTVAGHYGRLVANGGKNSAGACSATISVDLILRTPDDSF
jgi:hypothetical protein